MATIRSISPSDIALRPIRSNPAAEGRIQKIQVGKAVNDPTRTGPISDPAALPTAKPVESASSEVGNEAVDLSKLTPRTLAVFQHSIDALKGQEVSRTDGSLRDSLLALFEKLAKQDGVADPAAAAEELVKQIFDALIPGTGGTSDTTGLVGSPASLGELDVQA